MILLVPFALIMYLMGENGSGIYKLVVSLTET